MPNTKPILHSHKKSLIYKDMTDYYYYYYYYKSIYLT